jgi:hypothetical protein
MGRALNAVIFCVLFGCGRGAASPETSESQETSGWEKAQAQPVTPVALAGEGSDCCGSCPMALERVKLQYAPSGGGAAMLFTTANLDEEAELRRRVAELAAYHNKGEKLAMITHPHRADVQPIEGGARMDLIPKAVLNEPTGFLTEVEHEVRWMQDGHCPPLGDKNECVACDLPKR